MKIESIMTTKVVSVGMDDTLRAIRDIFATNSFHHLPVLESETLVGIITDRDVLRAVSPFAGSSSETARDAATLQKRVHQIMTRKPLTITKEETVNDAIKRTLENNITCLPVVTSEDHIDGIVTWKDLLRAHLQK